MILESNSFKNYRVTQILFTVNNSPFSICRSPSSVLRVTDITPSVQEKWSKEFVLQYYSWLSSRWHRIFSPALDGHRKVCVFYGQEFYNCFSVNL